jgi:Dyp-type peroxidase family
VNGLLPDEPVLATDIIQGDVLKGFGADHQVLLGLRIDAPGPARAWLAGLAGRLATVEDVTALRAGGSESGGPEAPWLNVAFSAAALRALGVEQRFADVLFDGGHDKDAAEALGDPDPDPGTWVANSPGMPIDVLLNVACRDESRLLGEVDALAAAAAAAGLPETYREHGVRLDRGIEHFGFADGVSQPGFLGRRAGAPGEPVTAREWDQPPGDPARIPEAKPGKPLLWPGEFVFGERRQRRELREPGEPARAGRPDDPPLDWADNGSLLVFRRLEQDVAGFHRFVREEAARLRADGSWPGLTPALLGALIVGRWPDGSPVRVGEPDDGAGAGAVNGFSFRDDAAGLRCPLSAHVRKVNPRGGPKDTSPFERRILRRGIPFGHALQSLEEADAETGTRGLLFLCYQTSIEQQFAFLATHWMNDRDLPALGAGHDVLVGQRAAEREMSITPPGGRPVVVRTPARWVRPTGGQFLFAPSVIAVAGLGEQAARASMPLVVPGR